ncbi:threonine/serine exporter family protein [Corynebacterium gerontici]|uniref:Inner membrane protein YjjP n=1 Tax=Corynebacterium gerontici TaxID=2079234 RepID=A0A3G6IY41_9CORY|nr:threonine/serine exporter family protein [Corynebacterium gerontici]AZA10679.1 Inner membrane protein YjjP [Corynebacterium gerontici]
MGVEADAVIRLGMMLAGAGSSGYRVMRAMKRAARALGFDSLDATVGITQITCTVHKGHHFRTVIARDHNPAVDASRIEAIETLTHNLHHSITAEELNEALDAIEHQVIKRWSPLWLSLAAAIACAGFAVLNHFTLQSAILVAISAGIGQSVRMACAKRRVHQLGAVSAGGLAAALSFFVCAWVLDLFGVTPLESVSAGYIAAVLFLIPGFPLFSSMIDLSRFDFDAGLARLSYSLTIIFCATFVVGMVSWLTGLNPEPVAASASGSWYVAAGVASFLGVAGFAFLFNSSRRMVLVAASVGTVANLLRLALLETGATAYFAAFVGGLIIGLVGAIAAKRSHLPRVTTTVPAAVVLIPGTAMFRAVYYLNSGDVDQSLSNAATASLVVVAIAAGLVLARMLTDKNWAFGHLIDFSRPMDPPEVKSP